MGFAWVSPTLLQGWSILQLWPGCGCCWGCQSTPCTQLVEHPLQHPAQPSGSLPRRDLAGEGEGPCTLCWPPCLPLLG